MGTTGAQWAFSPGADGGEEITFLPSGFRIISIAFNDDCSGATFQDIMHQVKFFKGIESDLAGLEKEMNTWLVESRVRVTQIFGNLAATSPERNESNSLAAYPYVASDVLLVVVYEVPTTSEGTG